MGAGTAHICKMGHCWAPEARVRTHGGDCRQHTGFSGESNWSARLGASEGLGFCGWNEQHPTFVHSTSQFIEHSLEGMCAAQNHPGDRAGLGGPSIEEELEALGGT